MLFYSINVKNGLPCKNSASNAAQIINTPFSATTAIVAWDPSNPHYYITSRLILKSNIQFRKSISKVIFYGYWFKNVIVKYYDKNSHLKQNFKNFLRKFINIEKIHFAQTHL